MAIAELIMPKMGESIMEATILKWHKKVGDHVKLDETILDIATDKVDSEIPSPVEGIVTEILYPVNNVVPVGSVIAKFETNMTSYSNAPEFRPVQPEAIVHAPAAPVPPIAEQAPVPAPSFINYEENIPFQPSFSNAPKPTGNNKFFSPLVLNIANSEGISLSELERILGTGADGRVSKKDVIQYITDKRAGKVPAFVPNQAPPQVVYVQQPPIQEYKQPPVVPVQTYQQPSFEIPTPVQQVVLQKTADTPVYIAPQPIIEQPVIYPQPIIEPIVETIPEPIVEAAPVSEHIVESVINPHPVEEFFVPQPIVEPVHEPIQETVHESIIEPAIIEQPVAQVHVPEPVIVIESVVEHVIAAQNPVFEAIPAPIVEEPFVAPAPPVVEPIVETAQPIIEPVPAVLDQEPVVETYVPQPVVEPVYTVQYETVQETILEPIIEKPFVSPPIVEQAPKNLVPVYLVPPTAPTVPLVTLAEGDSGKYTTPTSAHPSGNVEIIEMDRMRKLIAKHMVESKQTSAHVTSFAEADVTNMVLWRERVKNDFERREGTKITFTPMFIDCLVKVLKRFPLLNSSVEGDKIIIKKDLNIGMATALPTGNLIVPVIKGADQLNIVGLSTAVNKLAADARSNQLKPDDVTGGTFTFTNVGTFGTLMGTPIINQPQVAILAVGTIKKRPVVIESENDDTIGIRHMIYLSLSYDHRIIDGSVGSSFLSEVAKEFESWDLNRTWYHYL